MRTLQMQGVPLTDEQEAYIVKRLRKAGRIRWKLGVRKLLKGLDAI